MGDASDQAAEVKRPGEAVLVGEDELLGLEDLGALVPPPTKDRLPVAALLVGQDGEVGEYREIPGRATHRDFLAALEVYRRAGRLNRRPKELAA